MIRLSLLLGLAGLALLAVLVAAYGASDVAALMAQAGGGISLAGLFHLLPMLANAQAWRLLLPIRDRRGRHNPSLGAFFWFVWVREAVNGLLPVARIGGEVVCARLMVAHGLSNPLAIATLVADITVSIASQFLFTLVGLFLLVLRADAGALLLPAILATLSAAALLAALVAVQRFGLFGLLHRLFRALFGERWSAIVGDGARLDRWVRLVYQRRRRTLGCLLWQLAGWILGAGEIWLALRALGSPIGLSDAVMIEALAQGISSAAFVVPGALGIQEGGFLLCGALVGLSAETALALALSRRVRDLLLFVPALLVSQAQSSWRLLRPLKSSLSLREP